MTDAHPQGGQAVSELRNAIAKQLYILRHATYEIQADAALRTLSEAGRTYEQGVADGRAELEMNIQRQVIHIEALSAQLAQAREALEWYAGADRANYWDQGRRARTTLAALTAGSTEGKDG